jgi:DNA-directed RNA polymerase omega subunit
MEGLPEGVDSKFRYVLLVSKRAEQLIQGSNPKIKTRHAKPTRVAMEEIDRNQVKWQLTQPVEETTALESGTE